MNIRVKFWNKIAETALHGIERAGGYDVCDSCIVTLRSQLRREKIAAAAVKKAQHAKARYTVIHGRRAM